MMRRILQGGGGDRGRFWIQEMTRNRTKAPAIVTMTTNAHGETPQKTPATIVAGMKPWQEMNFASFTCLAREQTTRFQLRAPEPWQATSSASTLRASLNYPTAQLPAFTNPVSLNTKLNEHTENSISSQTIQCFLAVDESELLNLTANTVDWFQKPQSPTRRNQVVKIVSPVQFVSLSACDAAIGAGGWQADISSHSITNL